IGGLHTRRRMDGDVDVMPFRSLAALTTDFVGPIGHLSEGCSVIKREELADLPFDHHLEVLLGDLSDNPMSLISPPQRFAAESEKQCQCGQRSNPAITATMVNNRCRRHIKT